MDVGVYPYPHGDPLLIDKIVNEFLSQGKFDKLRKECMSDADTKPAYQNLQQRVESTVTQFLKKQTWKPDLNKNQLRDSLRKHILESGFFDAGINRIVDQVVNQNVLATVFMPEVEEVVYNYLSIPRPSEKNQKRGPYSSADDNYRSSRNNYDHEFYQENAKYERSGRQRLYSSGSQPMDQIDEDHKPKDLCDSFLSKERNSGYSPDSFRPEPLVEDRTEKPGTPVKIEDAIKTDHEEVVVNEDSSHTPVEEVKMEVSSEESQESLNRIGVESLQINEPDSVPVPDSDDSIPLEINEKSMSDSHDSEDSIMNQMSPISQGRLTPDIEEEKVGEKQEEEKVEIKQEEEKVEIKPEEKRPFTFIGRIPKIKREDSESSKSETSKKEKLDVKYIYSSDESDSSKSYGKSDSDDRKSKEMRKEDERREKEEAEKRKKQDDHHKSSKDRGSHDRSKDRKDRKRDKSRERHGSKKSSSSSSRERSSSRHKSSHHSRHKDSRSRDSEKKRKEEKRKSKSTDDHCKERNKKEGRRSTDRDSNERERDKTTGSRSQGESKKREKDSKSSESKGDKKEEPQEETEAVPEADEVVIEVEEDWVPEESIILVNEEWISSEDVVAAEDIQSNLIDNVEDSSVLDFSELHRNGALTKLEFPKLTDDFYVKFNSTGFKYFEEWEKTKLDCEEEFKEFVDEADANLDLISDDESDNEIENGYIEENRLIIKNLLKGLGNFRKSVMFDPQIPEFYRWTNNKFYQKYRKRNEKRERRNTEKNESDESIKENIERERCVLRSPDGEKENQERKAKALHLKLLNKYRRRAMRQGKHRRRHKRGRDISGGIKEKNENRNISNGAYNTYKNDNLFKSAVNETENWKLSTSVVQSARDFNVVENSTTEKPKKTESSVTEKEYGANINNLLRVGECNGKNFSNISSLSQNSEDNNSLKGTDFQKTKKDAQVGPPKTESLESRKTDLKCTTLPQNLHINLPPSPDSDDLNANINGVISQNATTNRKRVFKSEKEEGTPKKQSRRNYSQKYDSQDLYKPRPVLNSSRTRGRERGSEPQIFTLSSPVSRSSVHSVTNSK